MNLRHSRRRFAMLTCCVLSGAVIGPSVLRADDDPKVHEDGAGDAVIRRTDHGNDGPVNPNSIAPDLIRVLVGGWETSTPRTDPYAGSWKDIRDTDLIKIELEFNGLVNPPGPINLRGEGYEPYRYGPSPVYGYLELSLDRDIDTGGEIDNIWNRPVGAASRFGGRLGHSVGERQPITGMHFTTLTTRTGEEAHLSLCGCHPFSVLPIDDPSPDTFDAGDTWILTGRFFQRTHAFVEYSFAYGGSETGAYDPIVRIRFKHTPSNDQTTISFVYAKTMSGAARLTGQAQQPADLNAGNHTSIEEMLYEIRYAALNSYGPPGSHYDLLRNWADDNHERLEDFYERNDWDVLTLFGTTYSAEQNNANYVWTDVGPKFEQGDCNGDSQINQLDQQIMMAAIAQSDGTAFDADGIRNGQTVITQFGYNYAIYDYDYDGIVGTLDLIYVGYQHRVGDVNNDGNLSQADLVAFNTMSGARRGDIRFNPTADLDANDVIDNDDRIILLGLINVPNLTNLRR